MATPTIQTGANSTLLYYWEDNGFNATPNDSTAKTFGYDASLTSWDGSRNAVELFEPNDRTVAKYIRQQFSGSFSVDFVVGNPWWHRAVLATPTTSGTSAPYTHTYDGQDPSSFQIITANTRSDEEWILHGCWVESADISISVPGNVEISLNGAYAELEETQPTSLETQPTTNQEVLTFVEGTLKIASTTQRLIQNLSLSIQNQTDPVLELGSETPVDFSPKNLTLSVDNAQTHDDQSDDELERFLGSTGTLSSPSEDSMTITLDNGKSGSNKHLIKYDLTSAFPDEFSIDGQGATPDQEVENSMTNQPVDITVTAENDQSSAK